MIQLPSKAEFWWLVGLLEGEGSFIFVGNTGRTQNVRVKMCDLDTIEKVASIFEKIVGEEVQIRGRPGEKTHWSDQYEVYVYGAKARKIMQAVVPYMSHRRRVAIWQALNRYTRPKLKLDSNKFMESLLARQVPEVAQLTKAK